MKLVLIHGRSQGGKDAGELAEQWKTALAAGLHAAGLGWPDDVDVVFPFYANKLDEIVAQIGAPLLNAITAKGPENGARDPEFRGELLEEIARAHGLTDADIFQFDAQGPVQKGPLNWAWVHALLRALDKTPLGGSALDTFTRDVYLYLTYSSIQRVIDGVVAAAIGPGPCVVVGHSLGSVIGYNVLRRTAGVDVIRFITLGSPLGLRAIKRRLNTPLEMPACVRGWYNAFDRRDGVALYPLDAEFFPVEPSIENNGNINNHTDNRHGIAGYLDDREVARRIHEALVRP